MRRYAVTAAALLLLGTSGEARADSDAGQIVYILTLPVSFFVAIGNAVPIIGSSLEASEESPSLGWSVASLAVGGLSLVPAVAGLATYWSSGVSEIDEFQGTWVVPLAALIPACVNIVLGAINLDRWARARRAVQLQSSMR